MSDYFLLSNGTSEGILKKLYKKKEIVDGFGSNNIIIRSNGLGSHTRVDYLNCNSDNVKCSITTNDRYATYDDLLTIAALYNKKFINENSITNKQFNNLLQNIGTITSYYANDTPTQNAFDNPSSLPSTIAEYNNVYSKVQNQLLELKRTDNSIYQEKQKELDMAIYANLMWTVLATSIIYYIFIEL